MFGMRFSSSGQRYLPSFGALCLLLSGSFAQDEPKGNLPISSLSPASNRPFELLEGAPIVFSVEVPAGKLATVTFEQTKNRINVEWTDSSGKVHVPRSNDAGVGASIRFTLKGTASGTNLFRLIPYHPKENSTGRVSVSTVSAMLPADAQLAEAEEWYAEAENDRRWGKEPTWAGALEKFHRAAKEFESLGNRNMQRAALVGESRLRLFRLSDYDGARAAANAAVALPKQPAPGEAPLRALAEKTLSSALYYLGDYHLSMAAADRALSLYHDAQDHYWEGVLLGNLAYMQREVGDTEAALKNSESALALAREEKDDYGVGFSLEALGAIYLTRGEFEKAFETYQEALEFMRLHPYPLEEAAVWSGLGDLYIRLEDGSRAEDAFARALPLAQKANDAAGELKILSSSADLLYRRGKFTDAEMNYRKGLDRASQFGLPHERALMLTGLAQSLAAQHKDEEAARVFAEALDLAKSIHHRDAQAFALQALGDFHAVRENMADAESSYTEAATLWEEEANSGQVAIAQGSLARLHAQQGHLEKAQHEILSALSLIESSRATLGSQQLRTSYFSSKHSYYELAISLCMQLHAADPQHGYDRQALLIAERARARTLLDSMIAARSYSTDKSPALSLEEMQNRERLDSAYRRLRELANDPKQNEEMFRQIHTDIETLLREADEFAMRSPKNEQQGFRNLPSLEEFQSTLSQDSALLEYAAGDDVSYAWFITKDSIRTWTLPNQNALQQQAAQWITTLLAQTQHPSGESLASRMDRLNASERNETSSALRLGQELLPRVDELTPIHHLYIVADGPLASLPFAALRISSTKNSRDVQRSSLLISQAEIILEPSASILLNLSKPETNTATQTAAVFADPVYTATDPRVRRCTACSSASTNTWTTRWAEEAGMAHLPRLTASREEALAIQKYSGSPRSRLALGFSATPTEFRSTDWSRYSLAHFAAHALLNADHPDFSGVVLSMVRRDATPQDGVLWLHHIYSMRMPVSLVVLSGCRTASGQDVPGEGFASLSRAFFVAGAHRVIGSLWSVEDRSTERLMESFYRNLLSRRLPPAAALRAAQLSMVQSSDSSAPYFWAGFTLQGAPDTAWRIDRKR